MDDHMKRITRENFLGCLVAMLALAVALAGGLFVIAWPQSFPGQPAPNGPLFLAPQGRLTVASGNPYITRKLSCGAGCSGVIGANSVYWTPGDGGCWIPLWNGSTFIPTCCPEISNVLADSSPGNAGPFAVVANAVYDFYVYASPPGSGTCILSRSDYWQQVGTVTNTNASPAVFTQTGHGMLNGTPVRLVCSGGGSLSSNFTESTPYWVVASNTGAGTFQLAASVGGAAINAGSANTCGTTTAIEGIGNNNNITNAVTRGAANAQTRTSVGLLVNTSSFANAPGGALAGTYVGSCYTNTSGTIDYVFGGVGANGAIAGSLGCYNQFNKHVQTTQVIDTNSYPYAGGYRRAGGGSSFNFIDWLVGQREEGFCATYLQKVVTASVAGAEGKWGIGFDVQPVQVDTPPFIVHAYSNTAHTGAGTVTQCHNDIAIGRHEVQAIESTDGTNGGTFGNQDGSIGGALGWQGMN
jgi:hypothetical protein